MKRIQHTPHSSFYLWNRGRKYELTWRKFTCPFATSKLNTRGRCYFRKRSLALPAPVVGILFAAFPWKCVYFIESNWEDTEVDVLYTSVSFLRHDYYLDGSRICFQQLKAGVCLICGTATEACVWLTSALIRFRWTISGIFLSFALDIDRKLWWVRVWSMFFFKVSL